MSKIKSYYFDVDAVDETECFRDFLIDVNLILSKNLLVHTTKKVYNEGVGIENTGDFDERD